MEIIKSKGGSKSHDTCKHDIVSEIIKEFKKKKLKSKSKQIVTDKHQALAIALSKAHAECTYTPSDIKHLIEKVNNDLHDIMKELNLSNIIETRDAIQILLKKKSKKVYIFKKLLWDKIIKSEINNKKLTKHIWNEIKKIHEL